MMYGVLGLEKENCLIAKLLCNQLLGTYQSITQYYYFRWLLAWEVIRSDQIRSDQMDSVVDR